MRVPLVRDGLGRQANAASAWMTAIGKAETFERGRDLAAGWAWFRVNSPVGAARLMFMRRERCPEKPSGWARSSTLCTVSCSIIAVFPAGACCLGDETDESGAAFRMLPPVAGNSLPATPVWPVVLDAGIEYLRRLSQAVGPGA